MEVKVSSIKQAKEELKHADIANVKVIIASSYDGNVEYVEDKNKLVLHFDDITTTNHNSINKDIAMQINSFVSNIDFKKEKLYVCCDSGVSRSSAIAAAILRKYNEDEDIIWKNYNYQPNILVYKTLCDEFNLKNLPMRLRHKESMNRKALRKKIEQAYSNI